MRRTAGIVAISLLGLAACTRGGLPDSQVQAWVGRPAERLVREWGVPTREVEDEGQRVMIYEEVERNNNLTFQQTTTVRQAGTVQEAEAANTAARGPTVYARSYLFWVDTAGSIVRAQIRQP